MEKQRKFSIHVQQNKRLKCWLLTTIIPTPSLEEGIKSFVGLQNEFPEIPLSWSSSTSAVTVSNTMTASFFLETGFPPVLRRARFLNQSGLQTHTTSEADFRRLPRWVPWYIIVVSSCQRLHYQKIQHDNKLVENQWEVNNRVLRDTATIQWICILLKISNNSFHQMIYVL